MEMGSSNLEILVIDFQISVQISIHISANRPFIPTLLLITTVLYALHFINQCLLFCNCSPILNHSSYPLFIPSVQYVHCLLCFSFMASQSTLFKLQPSGLALCIQDKQLQLCLQNSTPPKPHQLQFHKEAAADVYICYMQRYVLKLTHVIDGNWILS